MLLFGSLYALKEEDICAELLILPYNLNFEETIERSISITKSPDTNKLWDSIISSKNGEINFNKLIGKMDINHIENRSLKSFELTEDVFAEIMAGRVRCFKNNTKVAAFIRGDEKKCLPDLMLVIDKKINGDSRLVDFDDLAAISNYVTFCQNAILNWGLLIKNAEIGSNYSRLLDLNKPASRDAFIAGLVISSTHNAAKLWPMITCVEMIFDRLSPEQTEKPEIKDILETYRASKEAMSNYFRRMNKWRQMTVVSLRRIDCQKLIQDVIDRYKVRLSKINYHITVNPNLKDSYALADETYFKETIENLLINSLDALSSCPKPEIIFSLTTGNAELPLLIKVIDNGHGFPNDDSDIVWLPEYTTKESGTGVGLAFVKYAVEGAFKGKVKCSSNPGIRTSFDLYLKN